MDTHSDPNTDNIKDVKTTPDNQPSTADESQCAIRPEQDGEEIVQLGLDSCGD